MMWLICWAFDHQWFDTVITHTAFTRWGRFPEDDYYVFGKFKERLCLRCGHEEAVFVEQLDSYDPYPGPFHTGWEPAPEWCEQPPQHLPLPGDWAG